MSETELLGTKIGHIRIVDFIAKGGMGSVYVGFDEKLERRVALKAIQEERLDDEARRRFQREARILSQLQHPSICQIYDYIEGDDTSWEHRPLEELANDEQLRAFKHHGFWHAMDTMRDKAHLEELWSSGQAPWKTWS